MNINLHIEKLVLDGLPTEARHAALIQEAVERELSKLILANGLGSALRQSATIPHLRGGNMRLGPPNQQKQPVELGRQIATCVFAEIGTSSKGVAHE